MLTPEIERAQQEAIVDGPNRKTPSGPPMNTRFALEYLQARISLFPGITAEIGDFFYMQLFQKAEST